jgi:hypothetical protein
MKNKKYSKVVLQKLSLTPGKRYYVVTQIFLQQQRPLLHRRMAVIQSVSGAVIS